MKSIIGLALVCVGAFAQNGGKVEINYEKKKNCLECLLIDGVFCESGANKVCIDKTKSCPKKWNEQSVNFTAIKGFNQCDRNTYFKSNDYTLVTDKNVDQKDKNFELNYVKDGQGNPRQINCQDLEMKDRDTVIHAPFIGMDLKELPEERRNFTVSLQPGTGCHFVATNNVKPDEKTGDEFIMGVSFMQNKYWAKENAAEEQSKKPLNAQTQVLVEATDPMVPAAWTPEATTENWQLFTNINIISQNDKGIPQKLNAANGRVPIKNDRPRQFLLINHTTEETKITVIYGAASVLTASILSIAGFMALSM